MLFVFLIQLGPAAGAAEKGPDPDIKGKYAVIMDRDTGRVLYQKDADVRTFPASTTKLMTALLAVEALDLNQSIPASRTAVNVELDSSKLGLKEGEFLTGEQLLYALLVESANDAANVLAEAISGSIPAFVELMNQKAAELGMAGTHFMNPHGYHDDNHYTTANDLAKLLYACMGNDRLVEMLSTPTYELPATNLEPTVRKIISTNSMITAQREYGYLYSPVKGGKTGHTSKAGYCFAAFGEKDEKHLITVVMGSVTEKLINYSFYDTKKLMEYGFNNFTTKPVVKVNELVQTVPVKWGAGGGQAALFADNTLNLLLAVDEDESALEKNVVVRQELVAPLHKGEILGTMEYRKDGVFLGKVDLVLAEDVKLDSMQMVFGTIWNFMKQPIVIAVIVLLAVVIVILKIRQRKKRQRERMKRKKNYRF